MEARLNAQQESPAAYAPFFTARERAGLAWTETLTLITEGHVPDDIYEVAKQSFSNEVCS
jgi:alkylhydroperoxidase family enzyme